MRAVESVATRETMTCFCFVLTVQPYTLKMFDAVLAVAHGLHNLLTNETAAVTKPVFENVCCNESVGAWEHGEYLLEHIAQVQRETDGFLRCFR